MPSKFSTNIRLAPSNKSERNFGLLITSFIIFFIFYHSFSQSLPLAQLFIGLTIVIGFFAMSFLKPNLFRLPLKLWMRLGYLMGTIISPIVLSAIFFGMITPVALVIRFLGRDLLRLKKYNTSTYWVNRNSDMQPSNSFKTQF